MKKNTEKRELHNETRQADRQIKSGHYVKHEDMKVWLLSLGTEKELPPPKCACGKEYNDEALCRWRASSCYWRGQVTGNLCIRGARQTRSRKTFGQENYRGG